MAHKISFYHKPFLSLNRMTFWTCSVLIFVLLIAGCNLTKDDNEQDSSAVQVLISFELATPIPVSPQMVDLYLDIFNILFGVDISIIQNIQQYTQYDVNVYSVTYYTVYNRKRIEASGAVIIPEMPGPFRILSFQSASNFEDSAAPSLYSGMVAMGNVLDFAMPFGASGYICSVADYVGFGAAGDIFHPYHQKSIAQANLDMLRATIELCRQLNIDFREEYFLGGYSEGGFATMALQKKIQLLHGDELPIIASSAGAGAYDIYGTMRYFVNSDLLPYSPITCFIMMAYHEIYEKDRDLCEIFQSPYCDLMANGLFSGEVPYEDILAQLTPITTDLFTESFIADFNGDGEVKLKTAFINNNLYMWWTPLAPTRLYHAPSDNIIPPSNSEAAYAYFSANGCNTVEYIPMPDIIHGFGFFFWISDTIPWFNSF
jgi:hypothetical protein